MPESGRGAPVLLGDVGGTNARFALAEAGRIGPALTLKVADHPDATEAIVQAVAQLIPAGCPSLGALALACAGPIEGNAIALTNSPWTLDATALRRAAAVSAVHLLNDFEAVAWSLPKLEAADTVPVGGGVAAPDRPAVALGPGTGLGVAAYVPDTPGPRVIVGEGGHATLPAVDDREAAVLAALRAESGHVSAERALSGDGLARLYQALAGDRAQARSAQEITEAAAAGDCPDCVAALDLFCAMLGTFAGNLALTFGAAGGVYIAGGIVPRFLERFLVSDFRKRFEAKGRFRDYLTPIPTWVVRHPQPAFLGLLHYLEHRSPSADT